MMSALFTMSKYGVLFSLFVFCSGVLHNAYAIKPNGAAENPPLAAANLLPDKTIVLDYSLHSGAKDGIYLGQIRHRFVFNDKTYRIEARNEAKGLASLFVSYVLTQISSGVLSSQGLQPQNYSEKRDGVAHGNVVRFDWSQRKVGIGAVEHALQGEAYDLLSLAYACFFNCDVTNREIQIVTARKNYTGEVLFDAPKPLKTELGWKNAIRLYSERANIQIWLSADDNYLPLQMVIINRKGHKFVQKIAKIS